MKSETKTQRIDQKSPFFDFFVFFLKIQDKRKPKTQIFEKGSHKNFLGQVLTIFQTSPVSVCFGSNEDHETHPTTY